jgi:tRNA A37 N6-isopentenylltransferase MiaA
MSKFRYKDDIRSWVKPMSYHEFWTAVEPLGLTLQRRAHCDDQIARGLVDEATVLKVLKYMAEDELAALHNIGWRPVTPWLKLVESH